MQGPGWKELGTLTFSEGRLVRTMNKSEEELRGAHKGVLELVTEFCVC